MPEQRRPSRINPNDPFYGASPKAREWLMQVSADPEFQRLFAERNTHDGTTAGSWELNEYINRVGLPPGLSFYVRNGEPALKDRTSGWTIPLAAVAVAGTLGLAAFNPALLGAAGGGGQSVPGLANSTINTSAVSSLFGPGAVGSAMAPIPASALASAPLTPASAGLPAATAAAPVAATTSRAASLPWRDMLLAGGLDMASGLLDNSDSQEQRRPDPEMMYQAMRERNHLATSVAQRAQDRKAPQLPGGMGIHGITPPTIGGNFAPLDLSPLLNELRGTESMTRMPGRPGQPTSPRFPVGSAQPGAGPRQRRRGY